MNVISPSLILFPCQKRCSTREENEIFYIQKAMSCFLWLICFSFDTLKKIVAWFPRQIFPQANLWLLIFSICKWNELLCNSNNSFAPYCHKFEISFRCMFIFLYVLAMSFPTRKILVFFLDQDGQEGEAS